ncbi:MAG: Hint domain-containing protein [Nitrosopumilaceae archaeon]
MSATTGCILVGVGNTKDPETGHKYAFNVICDVPTTCGLKNSWGDHNMGNTDYLDATSVNGTHFIITTNYGWGVCASESYNEQEKKATIIVNGLWDNDTVVNVLIPKVLLGNTLVTVDEKKITPDIIDHHPSNTTLVCPLCYYEMNMHLPFSSASKKIEIGAQSIPDTPLKQFKSGISAKDIQCKEGLVLITKTSDNFPACVKTQTAQKLVEREWGSMVIPNGLFYNGTGRSTKGTMVVDNTNYTVNYRITNATILNVKEDVQDKGLMVSIKADDMGVLTITIPRLLFNFDISDAQWQSWHIPGHYWATNDGTRNEQFQEINTTSTDRTFFIHFSKGTKEMEIFRPLPLICLSGNTMIDTPNGATNIKELKVGMRVWTLDDHGYKQSAVILKTQKTQVPSMHTMVHIVLVDDREVFASAKHPTADGRLVEVLKIGDILDNTKIKTIELISYNENYTYDILPSGPTGFYWANGILIGSTLK